MLEKSIISNTGIVIIGLYLSLLIVLGLIGRRVRKEDSLADFYLAGRDIGFFVLFLTLYATQYSGNTLIGFAGKAYREGFTTLVSVGLMMSAIGAYLVFAPKLFTLSRKYHFITIGDYIQQRFSSRLLTTIATIICIVALSNYILTNLKAIGHIVEISTASKVSFTTGVIFLSLIMVVYESLGGLRSVAWTDVIQGVLLLIGCLLILVAIEYQYSGISNTTEYFINNKQELWKPPTFKQKLTWLSTLVIGFFGVSIYPHAIQRIYSARNIKTLKKSFQFMIFMPLFTTLIIVIAAIVGITKFEGLSKQGSEEIILFILSDLQEKISYFNVVIIMFIAAAIAAIMSTIDSALLAISSLFTQDLYRPLKPSLRDSHYTFIGKLFSWIIMIFMGFLAIKLPQTIWKLMEIKLELLCQVAPAIFLGLHFKNIYSKSILIGLILGTSITLFLMFNNYLGLNIPERPLGIHAGVIGLCFNFISVYIYHNLIDKAGSTN